MRGQQRCSSHTQFKHSEVHSQRANVRLLATSSIRKHRREQDRDEELTTIVRNSRKDTATTVCKPNKTQNVCQRLANAGQKFKQKQQQRRSIHPIQVQKALRNSLVVGGGENHGEISDIGLDATQKVGVLCRRQDENAAQMTRIAIARIAIAKVEAEERMRRGARELRAQRSRIAEAS